VEYERYEANKADYEEYRIKNGQKAAGSPPEPPKARKRYRVKDITTETFGLAHSRNERGLLLYREEMEGWLQSFNQYKGGKGADEATWIEFYDGDSVQIDRMSRDTPEIFIRKAHACLIGCIQPRIYKQAITGSRIASGFLHRFLVIMPPEPGGERWREDEVHPDVTDRWAYVVESLYRNPYESEKGPFLVRMLPEAQHIMKAWVNETGDLMRALPDHLRGMCAKMEAIAAKFALVLQLVEWQEYGEELRGITGEIMERAVRIARWHRYEIARLYQQIDMRDEEGAVKEDAAYEALPREFTREDVMKAYGIKQPPNASRKIKGLVEQGKVQQVSRGVYRRVVEQSSALALLSQGIYPAQEPDSINRITP
jgi:hypothetical protein